MTRPTPCPECGDRLCGELRLLTEKQVASILNVTPQAMRNRRLRDRRAGTPGTEAPLPTPIGHALIRYRGRDVCSWITSCHPEAGAASE